MSYQTLVPCPACARHVRATEEACPFCRESLSLPPTEHAVPTQRLGRAALLVFGASLALSGCGGAVSPADDAAVTDTGPADDGTSVAAYGAPWPEEDGGIAPPYGIAPDDGG